MRRKHIKFLTFILLIICLLSLLKNKLDSNLIKSINSEIKSLNTSVDDLKIEKAYLESQNKELYRYKEIYDGLTTINIYTDTRYYDIPLTAYQQEFVQKVAEENGFSETYIYGLIQYESQFNENAVSDGEISFGVMQIHNEYAWKYAELAGLEEYDLLDFEDNVRLGISYLRYIRDYYISIGVDSQEELSQLILVSYNMGIDGLKSHIEEHGTITSRYGDIVLRNKMKIEQTSKEGGKN